MSDAEISELSDHTAQLRLDDDDGDDDDQGSASLPASSSPISRHAPAEEEDAIAVIKATCAAFMDGEATTWDLSEHNVDDVGVRAVADAIKQAHAFIEELKLGGNRIGDDGADTLNGVLNKCARLHLLDLSRNEIGDQGAEILSECIWKSKSLRSVSLAQNPRIGQSGAKAIAMALAKNTNITTVDYSGNSYEQTVTSARLSNLAANARQQRSNSGRGGFDGVGGRSRGYTIDRRASLANKLGRVTYVLNGRTYIAEVEDNGVATGVRYKGRTYPSPIEWLKAISESAGPAGSSSAPSAPPMPSLPNAPVM